ncbi:Benzoate 12-dioxygenase alpha subunit protein [Candidatus Micropelagos thuwalensis]|uniref:Benzoate 12-dioxygenase alpha subunit protein n=1 Tax=Candidatus Micropelagius thuwalensis TaxID=1397666 RepID=U2WTP5_9PROT|nr:MBL fold metallo-hydrolase [Candidatus Micropelagos thuwalensis]ERL46893.1 Benzoate 12-dioxygenase alpha subunit protein [Candidatus Micropelagos thuwalensis]
MTSNPEIHAFFDTTTNTISYIVHDPESLHCAIIDSVMDIDYAAGQISYTHADHLIRFITQKGWQLDWLIETHVHADHLSAAPYIQSQLGGKLGIGEGIKTVQSVFGKIFNEGTDFKRDGSQFDCLFKDGDTYKIGSLEVTAIHTPGHTPACMTHLIGDAAFVGDTLFMPDGGTARADFPGGDARALYRSIHRILSLPDETRLFMCHDYGPNGRDFIWQTTVQEQRRINIHVRDGITEDEFVDLRQKRDAGLDMPDLLIPSIQVNMRAGHFPEAEANGSIYLKVPISGIKN